MIYRGYKIILEAVVETAEYEVDEDSELAELIQYIDTEPYPITWGILTEDGDYVDWISYDKDCESVDDVKKLIDKMIEEEDNNG